jgi:hypothetical protein
MPTIEPRHLLIALVLTTACVPTDRASGRGGGADVTADGPTAGGGVPAAVAVAWNGRLLEVAEAEDGFLTLKGVRTAAMMHLAMHDALAAIEPRWEPFALAGVRAEADPVAAAAEAAYAVVVDQYPDADSLWSRERERWAGGSAAAADLGARAARAVLEARAADRWDGEAAYEWHPMGPGVYAEFNEHSGTPEGFVFGSGWAVAQPFTLDSPHQFRSPPPPAIDGDAYTRAFDEVKDVGGRTSTTRTPDQAHYAMWWKEFVERSHNRLARELIEAEGLDLWRATRLLALLNMSIFDGYVASFDAKFAYNHWRPYTAIRWAAHDGNPATAPDTAWTNLHDHTYAFPSYPSAHGTVCAAAMTVFEDVFGDRPVSITIPEVDAAGPFSPKISMDPATRDFAGFADAAEECSLSRLYLGIHFRYDSEAGTALGRRVGRHAVETRLRPTEGSS